MIDEEIRDALKVDPSPEFLARVRTRIASEPAPSAWRWPWTFAAAGAVAAAVVVALIWSPIESRPGPSGPASQGKPSASAGLAEARGATGRAEAEGPAPHQGSVVSGFSRTESSRQPEILVDTGEMRALQGLIVAARNGSIALTPATEAAPPAPMELEPVTDIVIAPITIDPIAPLPGAEGVRP